MNFYGNTAVVEFLNVNLTPGSVWFMAASQTVRLRFLPGNNQVRFTITTLMENTAIMLQNEILVVILKQSAKRGQLYQVNKMFLPLIVKTEI